MARSVSSVPTDAPAVGAAASAARGLVAPDDGLMMRRAADGDRAAFAQIATKWQDRIYNALRKMTGNEEDAADLTQETFVKALSHLSSFRNESSAYTWLFRIAMNLATSRFRQIHRRRTIQAGQLEREDETGTVDVLDNRPANSQTPDRVAQGHERDQQVVAALGRLPDDQRSLLVLRDVEGMEYQQIAEVLAVPLGTLKSRLFRARLALRNELRDYFDGREAVA